jgi:23S rRNA U2552 (ribose-2'-O)-methylase RlmE/FtsJ
MRKIGVQIDELETVIDVAVVDGNEPAEQVLSKVDAQLAEHRLEVVIYDAFENAISWRIETRQAR